MNYEFDFNFLYVQNRFQIVEQCFICLLNGGEWKQLADLASGTRGTGQAEAAVATALAAHHLRTKPTKKLPEDLWDMGTIINSIQFRFVVVSNFFLLLDCCKLL